jgi:4'-phosphopantetheinyl transferase
VSGAVTVSALSWPVADVSARIASHDVVVCSAALVVSDAELGRAVALLSARERTRHDEFTNAVVARRYAVGRAILREILGCALGMAPDRVPIGEGVHGKPALCGGVRQRPLWFSVAHCEDLLLVALSGTSEVGVDLERARAIEQWERVADRVLSPGERAQLRFAVERGEDAGSVFLRHWCRVEAELKAIGCGIAGLEDHRAGKRPLGLRVLDLDALPLPSAASTGGARYQAALALCAPGVDSARQSALATSQATRPTATPARASTA